MYKNYSTSPLKQADNSKVVGLLLSYSVIERRYIVNAAFLTKCRILCLERFHIKAVTVLNAVVLTNHRIDCGREAKIQTRAGKTGLRAARYLVKILIVDRIVVFLKKIHSVNFIYLYNNLYKYLYKLLYK